MQNYELISLINKIQQYQCEMQHIEVKAAEKGCPTRLFDTLSSFSNQDGGGIIVFGLSEELNFSVVGVYDAQDLQKRVTEQCKQMEPVVRPLFTMASLDGKTVVSAEIPGVDIGDRPVFYRGVGRVKGAYVRVGESDEQMSEYEVYSYEAYKRKTNDELRRLPRTDFTDISEDQLMLFLAKLRTKKPNLNGLTDEKNLALSGIYSDGELTLAGLMLFGLYPQASFPQYCITAVVIPGYEMGVTGVDGERFIDNKRIEGTITQMADAAIAFVTRNMREKTIIDENGKRADKPEYPVKAIREIILNALIHRDYSFHTEGSPVRVLMFRDRIEIENPGGLYGRLTLNDLGKVGADTRNPFIAANLEIMIDTENRFSGIPTIRAEMEKAGLPPPVFENRGGVFKVTLYNGWEGGAGKGGLQKSNTQPNTATTNTLSLTDRILAFCESPRSRSELVDFTGYSRYYTMSKLIQPLVESRRLSLTIPEAPKSHKQQFVRVRDISQK